MREILFRGKTKDKEKWVYGAYIKDESPDSDRDVLIVDQSKYYVFKQNWLETECVDIVIPETVGQYTGLMDKNGKKIFEGDIVKYTFDSPEDPLATENGLKEIIGMVFWSDWRASFAVTAGQNGSKSLNNDVARYVRGRQIYNYIRGYNTVEIIGNIHDNPELLKEVKS